MRKVVFLRVARGLLNGPHLHPTALVLQKSADGYLSIQGHTPVAWSERQRCWELFRKAAKRLLGLCEASAVSVCLTDPPYTAINDLVGVFRQPSYIVSLTLSPLPDVAAAEQEIERRKSSRAALRNWQPRSAYSGLFEQRPSPLSSPQAKRRTKLSGREMDKLLFQLDEVSQSLERTQTQCEAIARRCEGKAREHSEDTDSASEDCRVERLLRVAETLTAQIIRQQQRSRSPTPAEGVTVSQQLVASPSKLGAGLPDRPTGVCAQPNLNSGTYILWNPVRLDGRDRNNGCKVTGYAVYVDGVQRSKLKNQIGSHTEITGLENGMQYQIQVSTLAEGSESPLSPPVTYRHKVRSSSSSSAAPMAQSPTGTVCRRDQQARQSAKVENWLLRSSQSLCDTSHTNAHTDEHTSLPRFTECQDGGSCGKSDKSLTTPSGSTHLPDDARSVGSSHTSGIVMDHPPCSPKLIPSRPHSDGFSVHSETTTLIVDGHSLSNKDSSISPYHQHHPRFSPSPTPPPSVTPSRVRSPASRDYIVDTVIDEPLDFTLPPEREKTTAASIVHLVAGARHRGPAPPANIHARYKQPGFIVISWSPTRRDAKGCSNGCFVLGYRVYVNGMSQISVDGPMSYETTIRCPHLDSSHKLAVHVRTRSIAAESVPSSTVIYDLLLQQSLEQYSSPKANSAISSTVTLCPIDKPHPRTLHKSSALLTHTVSQQTYV